MQILFDEFRKFFWAPVPIGPCRTAARGAMRGSRRLASSKAMAHVVFSAMAYNVSCGPWLGPEGWRFSKLQEQWLYDEVDMLDDSRGPFIHRILFSTGVTLEIPFVSVIIHRFTVPAIMKQAKQSV